MSRKIKKKRSGKASPPKRPAGSKMARKLMRKSEVKKVRAGVRGVPHRSALTTEEKVAKRRAESKQAPAQREHAQLMNARLEAWKEILRAQEERKAAQRLTEEKAEPGMKYIREDDFPVPEGYRMVGMDEMVESALPDCRECNGTGRYIVRQPDGDDEICLCQCAYNRYQALNPEAKRLDNGVIIRPVGD